MPLDLLFDVQNLMPQKKRIREFPNSMNSFEDISIDQATATLRCGGVVAFPTDTVYGVGTDPFQPEAVRKLYQIKGRPMDKPIPILVGSVDDVQHVAQDLPPMFNQIAERFWPGGLTLIVKAKTLPSEVTAGGDTVGVRIPDQPNSTRAFAAFWRCNCYNECEPI